MSISRGNILTACERSQRYHSARWSFYTFWHKGLLIVVLLISMGGVGLWVAKFVPILQPTLLASIALLTLIPLVFDLIGRAQLHESLYRRFVDLNGKVEANTKPDDRQKAEWIKRLHSIYADEPPAHVALNIHCGNQVLASLYRKDHPEYKKKYAHLRWYHLLFMNFLRFNGLAQPK